MTTKLDAHKTHHMRGIILSGTLHIVVFITFLFNFHVRKHINLTKQSIPITITKLSDITTGPVLGPAGIIDETIPMANTDQDILPLNPNKPEDVVENNQIANSSTADKVKDISAKDKEIDEVLNLEPITQKENKKELVKEDLKEKQTNESKEKVEDIIPNLGMRENKKDMKIKDMNNNIKKRKDIKKDKDNKNSKNKSKDSASEKKGKDIKEGEFNKFISDVLGSEQGRTTKHSGGAQELGELAASTMAVLREMIRPCWTFINVPRSNEIIINAEVDINREGYVTNVKILDPNWSDPVYKMQANSVSRALADKRCQPFKLPSSQYENWKKIRMGFCPSSF